MAYGLSQGAQLSSEKSEWKFVCWPINSKTNIETDTTGSVEKKMYPDGHGSPKLSKADQMHILEVVLENPSIYLKFEL